MHYWLLRIHPQLGLQSRDRKKINRGSHGGQSRELVQINKSFGFAYGFKSHFTSINERFYKLEDCLQSRPNNQINIFPPFGNEFLPLSINTALEGRPILHTLKHKDFCYYDSICLMPVGLMFDDIIMNTLRKNKLECHDREDNVFPNIDNKSIYMYIWSLQYF